MHVTQDATEVPVDGLVVARLPEKNQEDSGHAPQGEDQRQPQHDEDDEAAEEEQADKLEAHAASRPVTAV